MNLQDALKGGPGLDGYTFNADTYCVDCGQDIIREVFAGTGLEDISEESNVLPYPIFFGESDFDTYCTMCGDLMYEGIGPCLCGRGECPQCGGEVIT